MPTPGSDHPITLEATQRRWRVYFNNHVIADTDDALLLREGGRAPVVYFPRQDVAMEYMGRTSHRTYCPYKGHADHFTLTLGGEILENVAWSYNDPLEAVGAISGRVAFYPGQVEIYAVDDAVVNPGRREREQRRDAARARDVDKVVQHTDAGDGASQRDRWAPNVEQPRTEDGGLR